MFQFLHPVAVVTSRDVVISGLSNTYTIKKNIYSLYYTLNWLFMWLENGRLFMWCLPSLVNCVMCGRHTECVHIKSELLIYSFWLLHNVGSKVHRATPAVWHTRPNVRWWFSHYWCDIGLYRNRFRFITVFASHRKSQIFFTIPALCMSRNFGNQ